MLTNDRDNGKRDTHGKLFAWGNGKVFQVRELTDLAANLTLQTSRVFMPL